MQTSSSGAVPDPDPADQFDVLSPAEQQYAIKTWRYLRLAMVGLVLALFAAIVEDRIAGEKHCWQGSISAYYYTPVHGFLIGALVAVGVCLYCLKGNIVVEDVLLNLAGMFAPVVAFVPTNVPDRCVSTSIAADRFPNVNNNMFALIVLETCALIAVALLNRHPTLPPTRADRWGYGIGVGVVAVEWVLWLLSQNDHQVFTQVVHYTAAIAMFVCIFFVVVVDSFAVEGGRSNRYTWVAILMVISLIVFAYLKWIQDWDYAVFQIEFCMIALFAVFWIGQTRDGWHAGLGKRTVPKGLRGLSPTR